jgi:hypothetical protein
MNEVVKKTYIIDTNILQTVFSTFNAAKAALPEGAKYGTVWRAIKNYLSNPRPENPLHSLDFSQEGSRWVMNLFSGNEPNAQLIIPSQTYNEAMYGFTSKVSAIGMTFNTMDATQAKHVVEKKKILDALRGSKLFNGKPGIEIESITMSRRNSPDKIAEFQVGAQQKVPILKDIVFSIETELQVMAERIKEPPKPILSMSVEELQEEINKLAQESWEPYGWENELRIRNSEDPEAYKQRVIPEIEKKIKETALPKVERSPEETEKINTLVKKGWDPNELEATLNTLESVSYLTEDQEVYKQKLIEYKAQKEELKALEDVVLKGPKEPALIPASIRDWLKTTDDPLIASLIQEGVVWYRDLHSIGRMDNEFGQIKDVVDKFDNIQKYLDPLIAHPSDINKVINANAISTLGSYRVLESLDREGYEDAKKQVIEDLVTRFSKNREELDINDFKIARYAFKYKIQYPHYDVMLLTFNTKQLGELSFPNFLYNLYDLQIKFPQIEETVCLSASGLKATFNNYLNHNIAQIEKSFTPLLAVERTRILVESLKTQLPEYYNSSPLPTSSDIFRNIMMLNNLMVEDGILKIDLDQLLKGEAHAIKLVLYDLKTKVFAVGISIDNIKSSRSDSFTIGKIEDIIQQLNTVRADVGQLTPKQINAAAGVLVKPLESLRTFDKHKSLLSIKDGEVKINADAFKDGKITPKILIDINKNLFDGQIAAKHFITSGTSRQVTWQIDNLVTNIGAEVDSLQGAIDDLGSAARKTFKGSMPTSCGTGGGKVKRAATGGGTCLDASKMKRYEEPVVTKTGTRMGAKLESYSSKLNLFLMSKLVYDMQPEDIPKVGAMIGAPIAAQIGIQKIISANPQLEKYVLKSIDDAFKTLPSAIRQREVTKIMHQLSKSTGINLVKNSPGLVFPVVNTIWSGININEAAKKLNTEEGKNSEGILIFTIVSESAIITCSLIQGGALAFGVSVPGLNLAITTIVVVQQLAYAINNGVDKVKEVNSKLSLTTLEEISVFFRGVFNEPLPQYLEDNILAIDMYKTWILEAIAKAERAGFDIIATHLPNIEYTSPIALERQCDIKKSKNCHLLPKRCIPKPAKNIHFANDNPDARLLIKSFSNTPSDISRIIERIPQDQQKFICAPSNDDVSAKPTVIHECEELQRKTGEKQVTLSLHTNADNGQNNICDGTVAIDLDTNKDNVNILYDIPGEVSISDPNTKMTSAFIVYPDTKTKVQGGVNYFYPTDNKWMDGDGRVNLSGSEESNIVSFDSGDVTANFDSDTKVDLILARNCSMHVTNSPTIKSLGNNNIFLQGDSAQQFAEVGLNDNYYIDLKKSYKIQFLIDVSNASDGDNTKIFASTYELNAAVILSIRTQFTFLSALQYTKALRELVITLTNSQKITIYNYDTFKDCIIQFQDGASLNLNPFKETLGEIGTIQVISMVPPEDWGVNAIINYLQEIEGSPFYEKFKFNLVIERSGDNSFYGYVSNIDTQHIVETTHHLTNYFSLKGSNNYLTVKDEVDIHIAQHNDINTIVRFANSGPWVYEPSSISHDEHGIKVEYMKTQTHDNAQIRQGGELPAINIITTNNNNSFLRIDFEFGNSYVMHSGAKTLTQDHAIIPDADSSITISADRVRQLKHKVYLPEMEVEEVALFFDDNDELVLMHQALNQRLSIKGNKNEVKFRFKNTAGYEIYPAKDLETERATMLEPTEYALDFNDNQDVILSKNMTQLPIIKILDNKKEVAIHGVSTFSQQQDVLTLNIGHKQLTIYGWDSNPNLRPIFEFKNGVPLYLGDFGTEDIIKINQYIKIESKRTVISHQLEHFQDKIEILDNMTSNTAGAYNPQCKEIIPEADKTYYVSEVKSLMSTNRIALSKAIIWWTLDKYYNLKIANFDKSQQELITLVQSCIPDFIHKDKLQLIIEHVEAIESHVASEMRGAVHFYTGDEGLHGEIQDALGALSANASHSVAEMILQLQPVPLFMGSEGLGLEWSEPSYYTSGVASTGGSSIINDAWLALAYLFTGAGHGVKDFGYAVRNRLESKQVNATSAPAPASITLNQNNIIQKSHGTLGSNSEQFKPPHSGREYWFDIVDSVSLLLTLHNSNGEDNVQHIASLSNVAIFKEGDGFRERRLYTGCHNTKSTDAKQHIVNNIENGTGTYTTLYPILDSEVCINFYRIQDHDKLPIWAQSCKNPTSPQELLALPKLLNPISVTGNLNNNASCIAQTINGYNTVTAIMPTCSDNWIINASVNMAVLVPTCSAASFVPLPTIPILQFIPSIHHYFNSIKHYLPENCNHKDVIAALGTTVVTAATVYSPEVGLMLSAYTIYKQIKSIIPCPISAEALTAAALSGASYINMDSIINSAPIPIAQGINNLQYLSTVWSILQIAKPYVTKLFGIFSRSADDQGESAAEAKAKLLTVKNFIEELKDLGLTQDHQEAVNNISNSLNASNEQIQGMHDFYEQLRVIEGNYFFDTME